MTGNLSEDHQRKVFRELVEAQDRGLSVKESRETVAKHFDMLISEVTEIERAGLAGQWPPL